MFLLLLTFVIGVFVGQHIRISFTPEFENLLNGLIAVGKAQVPHLLAAAQQFSHRTPTPALSAIPSVQRSNR